MNCFTKSLQQFYKPQKLSAISKGNLTKLSQERRKRRRKRGFGSLCLTALNVFKVLGTTLCSDLEFSHRTALPLQQEVEICHPLH